MNREPSFLFLVDREGARWIRCGQSAGGNLHLDERETFESEWAEREHGRPSPLSRRGVQAYGERREREDLDHLDSAARQWAAKLEELVQREHPVRVLVLGPVRLLPRLRGHTRRLPESVEWESCDLTPLNLAEIARHPRVVRWAAGSVD